MAVIDVQQLRALVELARLGTVSAAAESLGYSQSAVSHQLAALSRATGAVLLTRAGRGVRLTEEGRALAARGREVIDLLERTEREAVAMAHAEEGRILLAAFPSAVASLVPGILAVVSRRHPGLEIELVDAEPPEALDSLRRGRVDAALSFSYIDDDAGEDLETVRLLDDVLYLVTHPLGIEDIADGAQCRWVTGCARCHEQLIAVGRANGFTPETAYASDDYVAVQALVAAGVGAAPARDGAERLPAPGGQGAPAGRGAPPDRDRHARGEAPSRRHRRARRGLPRGRASHGHPAARAARRRSLRADGAIRWCSATRSRVNFVDALTGRYQSVTLQPVSNRSSDSCSERPDPCP